MVVNNHHGSRHRLCSRVGRSRHAGLPRRGARRRGPRAGRRACRACSPSTSGTRRCFWFSGYVRQSTPAIAGGYYRTGDTVELEPTGAHQLRRPHGRRHHLVGLSHRAVRRGKRADRASRRVEAAVIGKPDPERTEIVKAFVVLKPGFDASDALAEELRQYVGGGCRRTPIRARSISSSNCPRRRAARSSASSCATRGAKGGRKTQEPCQNRHCERSEAIQIVNEINERLDRHVGLRPPRDDERGVFQAAC